MLPAHPAVAAVGLRLTPLQSGGDLLELAIVFLVLAILTYFF